jgi:membrane fusion protein, multidrug efflux system
MPSAPTTELSNLTSGSTPPPEPRKNGWVKPLVYLVLLVLVGLGVWRIATARNKAAQQAASRQQALMNRPTPVQVAPVQQRSMPIYLTALGTVTPYYSVTVKARVGGELTKVDFREGQEVHEGQTLMVIDPRPYQAALDQAKGNLAKDQALLKNAQTEYNRYKALFQEGVVSKESMDTQESSFGQYQGAIEADKAAIDNDALQLKWCYITSPITGRIGLRLVDPGNVITANTTNLVIINQFRPIAVYFTLPEEQLPQVLKKLRDAQRLPVQAYDRSDTQKIDEGYLLTADNQIDTTTGTGKLKAVFSNNKEELFPNQFVNIHLVLEQRPNALVIPSAALQHGTQGDYVWITKSDDTVDMQPVKILLAEGSVTIVDSGVQPGQQVVVDGADKLRPGARIEPHAANFGGQRRRQGQSTTLAGAGASSGANAQDTGSASTDQNSGTPQPPSSEGRFQQGEDHNAQPAQSQQPGTRTEQTPQQHRHHKNGNQ